MRPELRNRLLLGFGIGGLVIAGVALDMTRMSHQAILALGLIGAVAGCREFVRMARQSQGTDVLLTPMVVMSLLMVLEAHLHRSPSPVPELNDQPVIGLLIALALGWVVLAHMLFHGTERFFSTVGASLFGIVYLGVTLNLLERLAISEQPHNFSRGNQLFVLFLSATKMGDVAAYFGGRAFGRHKMAPHISPGKTWEGFLCSFIGSLAGVYLCNFILGALGSQLPFDHWWKLAIWALVLGPCGVAGDLAESCMKRDAAVKDSGSALPGFGGFLDILDALILAAPVAYILSLIL